MGNLDGNIFLCDILKKHPETLEVFLANGFEDFAKNDAFIEIGPFVRLKTILKVRDINEKHFIGMLDDKINANQHNEEFNHPKLEVEDKMNLLALLPCPLKLPVQEALNGIVKKFKNNQPNGLNYLIVGNANNQLSYYDFVERFDDVDEIPDIVISPGINSFYYKSFVEKFIDKGFFVDASKYAPNKLLSNIGIKDMGGNYTILSMNLLVMVVDKLRIGATALPKTWGDLLQPEFEKKIAIRGQGSFFCETTLLTIFKQYGMDGIKRLGKAVKYGWHPSQMAKMAGRGRVDSPVISVMPYFFTKTIKHKENVEVVWPEDGAIISPVTMLVKAEKAEKLKMFTDFFTGSDIGRISASASFPTMHPEVDNKIPESASFNWIGWDFIKGNDIGNLVKRLNDEVLKLVHS